MPSSRQGSIHLFRLAGVDLYLHWSWFVVAAYEIYNRGGRYTSVVWSVAEYLALFAIVLLHEFGHAMACRQVGGTADTILLWPFGGVAYVRPPQRPGATLWSLAAGPLVNVLLLPALIVAVEVGRSQGWRYTQHNLYHFLVAVLAIDGVLLAFNMLPIYPLDGGQILRSLLWYVLGAGRSLMVATVVGLAGGVGLIGLAVWARSVWTGAIALYMLTSCWGGFKHAQALRHFEKLPRRGGFACPSCGAAPPLGDFWGCDQCERAFDTFASGDVCPNCGRRHATTTCLSCREQTPMSAWVAHPYADTGVVSASFETK